MGKKINTRNKNFLADLQARMKDRYNSIHNGIQYSEVDKQRAELISVDLPEPVNATVPRKITAQHAQETTLTDFEKEYQDFIAKLKAKKEAKEKAVKEMEEQKEEIKPEVEVVEEKPKRKRKTSKKKDESTPKKEKN